MREYIMKLTITKILLPLLGVYGILLLSIYYDLVPILLPVVVQEFPTKLLLKFLIAAIGLCILLFFLSFSIYFILKTKLVPKFGVLWDKKEQEPYCPVHKNPLARHKTKIGNEIATGLDCRECDKSYPLIDDNGKTLTLIEAKKLL